MNLKINDRTLESKELSLAEFLTLLILKDEQDIVSIMKQLNQKEYILYNQKSNVFKVSDKGLKVIANVLRTSKKSEDELLLKVAEELKSIYPKGLKEGTNSPWTQAVSLIAGRLTDFIEVFGKDLEKYEDNLYDVIIEATKKYVDSFNGEYKYMRILHNFIMVTIVNNEGKKEMKSDLLTAMENLNNYDTVKRDDWTSTTV